MHIEDGNWREDKVKKLTRTRNLNVIGSIVLISVWLFIGVMYSITAVITPDWTDWLWVAAAVLFIIQHILNIVKAKQTYDLEISCLVDDYLDIYNNSTKED